MTRTTRSRDGRCRGHVLFYMVILCPVERLDRCDETLGSLRVTACHPRLELRRAFRDGTTHILMAPLTLIEKLAALVPPPFFNLVTYHGILAPNASTRAAVVPKTSPRSLHGRARNDQDSPLLEATPHHLGRADELLGLDVLECPRCGGPRRLIALISDPPVIRAVLTCFGLPIDPPTIAPARAPPIEELLADQILASR